MANTSTKLPETPAENEPTVAGTDAEGQTTGTDTDTQTAPDTDTSASTAKVVDVGANIDSKTWGVSKVPKVVVVQLKGQESPSRIRLAVLDVPLPYPLPLWDAEGNELPLTLLPADADGLLVDTDPRRYTYEDKALAQVWGRFVDSLVSQALIGEVVGNAKVAGKPKVWDSVEAALAGITYSPKGELPSSWEDLEQGASRISGAMIRTAFITGVTAWLASNPKGSPLNRPVSDAYLALERYWLASPGSLTAQGLADVLYRPARKAQATEEQILRLRAWLLGATLEDGTVKPASAPLLTAELGKVTLTGAVQAQSLWTQAIDLALAMIAAEAEAEAEDDSDY
jgi:hypothetical protein